MRDSNSESGNARRRRRKEEVDGGDEEEANKGQMQSRNSSLSPPLLSPNSRTTTGLLAGARLNVRHTAEEGGAIAVATSGAPRGRGAGRSRGIADDDDGDDAALRLPNNAPTLALLLIATAACIAATLYLTEGSRSERSRGAKERELLSFLS